MRKGSKVAWLSLVISLMAGGVNLAFDRGVVMERTSANAKRLEHVITIDQYDDLHGWMKRVEARQNEIADDVAYLRGRHAE